MVNSRNLTQSALKIARKENRAALGSGVHSNAIDL